MNMDMDMNHDHSTMSNTTMQKHWTHMTFFWGSRSEILFAGWPGDRTGMYALALIILFALSIVYEWLNHCRPIRKEPGRPSIAAGLVQAATHAVRVGLMYLIMLAVMSFNIGVLVVVVAGHAVGFVIFGKWRHELPPMGC